MSASIEQRVAGGLKKMLVGLLTISAADPTFLSAAQALLDMEDLDPTILAAPARRRTPGVDLDEIVDSSRVPDVDLDGEEIDPAIPAAPVRNNQKEDSLVTSKDLSNNNLVISARARGEIVAIITAGDLVGAYVDSSRALGVDPIGRDRARIGKDAKELLAAGKDPDVVTSALKRLVTRGRPVASFVELVKEVERERAGHPVQRGTMSNLERDARSRVVDNSLMERGYGVQRDRS